MTQRNRQTSSGTNRVRKRRDLHEYEDGFCVICRHKEEDNSDISMLLPDLQEKEKAQKEKRP
jgi:hypothetical protein